MKCISLVWLSQTDLSNLNSGQGSGNLTELKTYDRGHKPYVSGQAIRTALFETMARSHEDKFKCTAERPCGEIETCWGCDLRGFLSPKKDVGAERRWSPLKVTPGLGQVAGEIVTDLLIRMSEISKDESDEAAEARKDQRIAHIQMTSNIYKFAMIIDVANIGVLKVPVLEGSGKDQKVTGWQVRVDVGEKERKARIVALLDAVFNLSGFAKQARAAASLAPDIILASLQNTYNQRGIKALELDDKGNVLLDRFSFGLEEHAALGNKVLFGYTPDILPNQEEVLALIKKQGIPIMNVVETFKLLKESLC